MKTACVILFLTVSTLLNAQTWSGTTPGDIYYNSGNIGIGTSSPTTKLQVYGGAFQQVNNDLHSGIYLDATASDQPKIGWRVSDNS